VSGATGAVEGIVGREAEVVALGAFVGAEAPRRALCLIGPPGAGKTTLWEAGIALAREQGLLVLSAQPSGAEAELSFAALIDLCEEIDAAALSAVPAPQRSALEVALLRAEPTGTPPQPHAIALGFLNGLRALAARRPVLVAVDDVQWLDAPSADALTSRRAGSRTSPCAFCWRGVRARARPSSWPWTGAALSVWTVGPLSFGATRRLLSERSRWRPSWSRRWPRSARPTKRLR
jgi:AAA ATPase domain